MLLKGPEEPQIRAGSGPRPRLKVKLVANQALRRLKSKMLDELFPWFDRARKKAYLVKAQLKSKA